MPGVRCRGRIPRRLSVLATELTEIRRYAATSVVVMVSASMWFLRWCVGVLDTVCTTIGHLHPEVTRSDQDHRLRWWSTGAGVARRHRRRCAIRDEHRTAHRRLALATVDHVRDAVRRGSGRSRPGRTRPTSRRRVDLPVALDRRVEVVEIPALQVAAVDV